MLRRLALAGLVLPCSSVAACEAQETAEVVTLCADCGIEKGAAGCCDPNAERCSECKKIKGSAGCCK